MTTTWKALGETQDSGRVPAWDLDEIGRRYDAAKLDIADPSGAVAEDVSDPWPTTEAIDVRLITPPAASRGSRPQSAVATGQPQLEATEERHSPDPSAALRRTWRACRRWFASVARPDPGAQ